MPKPEVVQTKAAEVATPKDCSIVNQYDWDKDIAFKICTLESRGNHLAHNYSDVTKDDSYGLFQINLYGNLKHGRPSPDVLKDPKGNADYAYKLYKANGWSPWSTFAQIR